jgi:hypothetical protein
MLAKKVNIVVGKKVEVAEFLATYRSKHGSMGQKNPPVKVIVSEPSSAGSGTESSQGN